MPEPDDPAMADLQRALLTPIGAQEIALTEKYGTAGYLEWKSRDDRIQEAQVRCAVFDSAARQHNAEFIVAQGKYLSGKATFWSAVSCAILAGTLCGTIEFIRWAVGGQ